MGLRHRIIVALILSLISLSVLSLHIALCFHYPSALFAVTLLLNPSLWLFVGLMSMFCTLILSFRDKRRKLVPAACSSCRSTLQTSRLRTSPNRFYHHRWREPNPCRCSERSLLTRYSSDSSVQTRTQLLSSASDVYHSQIQEAARKLPLSPDSGSLFSLESSLKALPIKGSKDEPLNDVQNFSCLFRNDAFPEPPKSTIIVLGKDGETKSVSSDITSQDGLTFPKVPRKNSSRLVFCSYSQERYQLYATDRKPEYSKAFQPNTFNQRNYNNHDYLTNETEKDLSSSIKEAANFNDMTNYIHNDRGKSVNGLDDSIKYSMFGLPTSAIPKAVVNPPEGNSLKEPHKRVRRSNDLSRCTCPARFYLNYGSRANMISKTNKPKIKCANTFKPPTPVHLFQVRPDGKQTKSASKENERSNDRLASHKDRSSTQKTIKSDVLSDSDDDLSLDIKFKSSSCSSITSLLPK